MAGRIPWLVPENTAINHTSGHHGGKAMYGYNPYSTGYQTSNSYSSYGTNQPVMSYSPQSAYPTQTSFNPPQTQYGYNTYGQSAYTQPQYTNTYQSAGYSQTGSYNQSLNSSTSLSQPYSAYQAQTAYNQGYNGYGSYSQNTYAQPQAPSYSYQTSYSQPQQPGWVTNTYVDHNQSAAVHGYLGSDGQIYASQQAAQASYTQYGQTSQPTYNQGYSTGYNPHQQPQSQYGYNTGSYSQPQATSYSQPQVTNSYENNGQAWLANDGNLYVSRELAIQQGGGLLQSGYNDTTHQSGGITAQQQEQTSNGALWQGNNGIFYTTQADAIRQSGGLSPNQPLSNGPYGGHYGSPTLQPDNNDKNDRHARSASDTNPSYQIPGTNYNIIMDGYHWTNNYQEKVKNVINYLSTSKTWENSIAPQIDSDITVRIAPYNSSYSFSSENDLENSYTNAWFPVENYIQLSPYDIDQTRYITPKGQIAHFNFDRVFIHELIHAITGKQDPYYSSNTPHYDAYHNEYYIIPEGVDFKGPVVHLTNKIYEDLYGTGKYDRVSYDGVVRIDNPYLTEFTPVFSWNEDINAKIGDLDNVQFFEKPGKLYIYGNDNTDSTLTVCNGNIENIVNLMGGNNILHTGNGDDIVLTKLHTKGNEYINLGNGNDSITIFYTSDGDKLVDGGDGDDQIVLKASVESFRSNSRIMSMDTDPHNPGHEFLVIKNGDSVQQFQNFETLKFALDGTVIKLDELDVAHHFL